MSVSMFRAAGLGLLLLASPVLAQPAPPAPPEAPMMGRGGNGPYAGMSEAGRTVMREAMRANAEDRRANREAVKAARDRMMAVVEADRLDTAALKRAMDDERNIAMASHDRRQAAMLAGLTKLSTEDRKAFVAGARASRERMASRMDKMRERWGNRAERRGNRMAPPQQN
ncbi:hypothetical protein GCM10007973_32600 [Polymorphobacter multimanifer]|uniref:Putative membrane protein n=1 Tax=Polymorphobacter multimanifer TaxID=1070431 RepID=A0A841L1K6_9SPHN|nr:periplasmic heavy metal sensor [Polymorphobacter multimanifer]MBB6226547.1 putative membrane protein [Polymorphobacter multimanifer]GGI93851.1 hypothetical protein GCM10007973_32600 [Polymorphobacter multimanifer]